MSMMIETKNRGEQRFGFYFGGAHRVVLGELPAMPTPQFCQLAGDILIQLSNKLDEQSWKKIGNILRLWAYPRDEVTPVDKESIFDLPEHISFATQGSIDLTDDLPEFKMDTVTLSPDMEKRFQEADDAGKRKIMRDIIANLVVKNGWTASPYQNNPFTIEDGYVEISGFYQVSFLDFGTLVAYILSGGTFGWDEKGMPKTAKEVIAKLRQIW